MSYRRLRPRAGCLIVAFAVLAVSPAAHSTERVQQLAEDGVATRYVPADKARPAAAPYQICEPGARWIRLGFGELALSAYDSLTVVSSSGERQVFEGDAFGGRSFATRALRGDCVSVEPSFGNTASRYRLESYQFGTQALEKTTVVVAGAGDICDSSGNTCKGTSDLIVAINPTAVFTAGDNAYSNGTLSEYNARYAPTWGRFKTLTNPSPGNHDYYTSGASGYFDYFNGSGVQTGPAGDRSKGYYSWDVGDWHFISLNTMSGGTIAQAQLNWLQSDLAASTKPCTAAYFHHPLLSVGNYSGYTQVKPIWDRLYAAKADLVLVGHDHNYQRYAPMKPDKTADSAGGIRQVLVGTGGRTFYAITGSHALLEKSNANSYGVLKLTLTATGYTGEFMRSTGTFTDSFSGSCHNATLPPNVAPAANFSVVTSGAVANFTDTSTDSDGTIASRSWTFGDGASSTATNPSHAYAAAGTYTATLTVTDNRGGTGTTSRSVSVTAPTNTPPVASFSASVSDRNVTFTDASSDSDGSIVSRSWNFGDGTTSTATNPAHTYAAAGTYTVTLSVTDNAGASATTSRSVTTGASNTLQNGVARTGLAAATGAALSYTMVVPAGATNLRFAIAGGSGDADLYVKFGSAPTTSSYDCRPYIGGNSESCPIATARAGTYYVMVRGYAAFSGLSLTGSYTP